MNCSAAKANAAIKPLDRVQFQATHEKHWVGVCVINHVYIDVQVGCGYQRRLVTNYIFNVQYYQEDGVLVNR